MKKTTVPKDVVDQGKSAVRIYKIVHPVTRVTLYASVKIFGEERTKRKAYDIINRLKNRNMENA